MRPVSFRKQLLLTAALFSISLLAARAQAQPLDSVLRSLLDAHGMHTPDAGGGFSAAQIELGRALFFDRELSGNRDTACATCHHPNLMTADGLNLPVGVAPQTPGTLGRHRLRGADRSYIPRHAPEAFNRGSALWTSMFWDSRVAELGDGTFASPAGADLLPGLESVVAVQAMFPVTSREEMRGASGDVTYEGDVNEIALIDDSDIQGIWSALMGRLGALDEYRALFEGAYPGTDFDDMTFAHAANAIAAFEISQFTFLDTPFDRYLQGDRSALTPRQKRGAILFYGSAQCANCHAGPLMTDQRHWSLAVPQLGPGVGDEAPNDIGRYGQTGAWGDLFAFRTPPLRNVAKTGPYMHNGAFDDLRSVIRHHASPLSSLFTYQPRKHLRQRELIGTVLWDSSTLMLLALSLDYPRLPGHLTEAQIGDLEQFLHTLTAPRLRSRLEATIPDEVPSGQPVDR